MAVWTVKFRDDKKALKNKYDSGRGKLILYLVFPLLFLTGFIYFQYFYNPHTAEMHPQIKFKDKLKEVCANPRLPPLEYNGIESFFEYLTHPDQSHCYSWLEFGGEKIIIPTQTETECIDEVRKSKFMCFNEEYEMTKDPCLVYSFTKDEDQQFERDMHMFSCNTHVFDAQQVTASEHVRRTEFWMEHAWDIAEYPYDKNVDEDDKGYKGGVIRRRSLDYITHVLKHEGKVIKFLKCDHEGREWILLKQIVTHHDLVDVRQIGARIHLPVNGIKSMTGTARHEFFRDLFEVFQGLNCLGYKYIMGRPVKYFRGGIKVPEVNKTYYPAYEVNFAKVMNIPK